MPTYSYRCTSCGTTFDVRQSFSDPALTVCEKCGGDLRKLFNSVGIVFKGSGFYHNDSRSSASLTPKSEDSSSSSSSSSTSSSASSSTSSEGSGSSANKAAASN